MQGTFCIDLALAEREREIEKEWLGKGTAVRERLEENSKG